MAPHISHIPPFHKDWPTAHASLYTHIVAYGLTKPGIEFLDAKNDHLGDKEKIEWLSVLWANCSCPLKQGDGMFCRMCETTALLALGITRVTPIQAPTFMEKFLYQGTCSFQLRQVGYRVAWNSSAAKTRTLKHLVEDFASLSKEEELQACQITEYVSRKQSHLPEIGAPGYY